MKNLIHKADYDTMLAAQNGLCAICQRPPTSGRGKKLHVDHDHGTGCIRGLLCHDCNTGLGKFLDSPSLLQDAISYLQHQEIEP